MVRVSELSPRNSRNVYDSGVERAFTWLVNLLNRKEAPVYQWGEKESFAQIVEKGFPEAPWNVNRGEKRLASPSLSDESVKVKSDKA